MKYIIYTDGGSRGNPGPASAAFILKSAEGKKISEHGFYMGTATNNEAEYTAVEKAFEFIIKECKDLGSISLEIRADSQLVVNQLSDEWKIKNDRIRVFYNKIKGLEANFAGVTYKYIARALNFEADAIVNSTLDNH